jgi:predicted amidophosphoribosyltransferase
VCEICGRPLPSHAEKASRSWLCRLARTKLTRVTAPEALPCTKTLLYERFCSRNLSRMGPLGVWSADQLAGVARNGGNALGADVVVPVPLRREQERERGYNQAALISEPLSKKLGLPHKAVLVMRTRARPDKRILSLEERWKSVRGAFATRQGSQVDNLRVLLVDDVLTTGATLDLRTGTARRGSQIRNPLPNSSTW